MKQLLVEHISPQNAQLFICEEKGHGGRMVLKGKIQESNTKNGNGRRYPKEILEREFDKYKREFVSNRTSTGELDHPDTSIISLNNVSHLITDIWWEGDAVMAKIELLNTPSGRIAQELISANIPLGISTRGMGSVKQIDENTVEVQDDFDLLCADLVSTPSTPNAYMKLSEGLENITDKYLNVNNIITDIICNQGGFCECKLK